MKKHFKVLNESEYNIIRTAMGIGIKNREIIKSFGRSASTVSIIKRSNNWEDYKVICQNYWNKKQTPVKEPVAAPPKDSEVNYISKDQELLNALWSINQNLERLVKAWESKPDRKGIFG